PVKPGESWGDTPGLLCWWQAPDAAPRRIRRGPGGAGQIPPGVFEQVHRSMGERIRVFALDQLRPVTDELVWDLYAGVGETSALLVGRGARVESVELEPEAVATAERVAPERVTRHIGTVEGWIDRMSPPSAVITNPPRAGMAESVVRGLVTRRPGRIVYISCDPATLARDLSRFGSAYRVTALRSFDLFPQTAHLETVVRLDRA
ncbi:MAG TPA: hypothetical protein VJU15_06615, partial [Gemmatimonadales bacterium]|nr:hypothetical protein [Gemmatimonadales bacterium]